MMSKTLTHGLIVILLIPYSLFLFEVLAREVTLKNIIKVAASVFGPIPLVLFLAYIFIAPKNILKEIDETRLSTIVLFSLLLSNLLITVISLYFFEWFIYSDFSETVVPIFFNSLVLVMYIANILLTKSLKMIAILSGISMGISIYVLFI